MNDLEKKALSDKVVAAYEAEVETWVHYRTVQGAMKRKGAQAIRKAFSEFEGER